MKRLTQDQRALVADNVGLAMLVLSRIGLAKDEEARCEVMIPLCHAASGFEPERGFKFSTYAYRVMTRWMWDWSFRQRRHNATHEPLLPEPESMDDYWAYRRQVKRRGEPVDQSPLPDELADQQLKRAALDRARVSLNPRQQMVLACERRGLNLCDTGKLCGVTKEAIRQTRNKYRRQLAARVERDK